MRTLARAPGFTAVALVVLSLGIGANATIFSFANAFFLRPLPVSDPGSVVRCAPIAIRRPASGAISNTATATRPLSGLAAFQMKSFGLLIDRETEHVFGEIVSGETSLDRRNRTGAWSPPAALDDRLAHRPLSSSLRFLDAPVRAAPDAIGKRSASPISRSR